MPPDWNGERGIEASVLLGGGSLFDTSERLFWNSMQASGGAAPPNALSGGFNLAGVVGWRFLPWLSAGVSAQALFVSANPVMGSVGYDTTATSYAFGVYARLYLSQFLFHAATTRQVNFQGLLDVRRLDPWVSFGIEYQTITRTQTMPLSLLGATWYRQSIGLPIMAGFDVRVLPPLAVGVALGIGPWIGGWGHVVQHYLDTTGNPVNMDSPTSSVAVVDGSWFAGIDLRYTFTW
jgi:hypothetical protein